MRNKTIIFALLILCVAQSFAQGIQFTNKLSWTQIRAKAEAENKFILLDAYTTWCGPCKMMSDSVFPLKVVGDSINPYFVSVKMQMDRTTKDNEFIKSSYADAEEIEKNYRITGYPTILFFSPSGKLVSRALGFRDGASLISEAKKARDPKTQFYTLYEQYQNSKMDTAAMKRLVYVADELGEKVISRKIAENYASFLKDAELFQQKNLMFLGEHLNGSKDKNFEIFFNHPEKVNEIVEIPNYAESIVMNIVSAEEIDPYINDKDINWTAIEQSVRKKYGVLGEERLWARRMLYAMEQKDWINYGKYYKKYFERAIPNNRNSFHLNNMSWLIVEHVNDSQVLMCAINTMEYSIKKFDQENYQAYDTYANLLYKIGRKDDAIAWQTKASVALPEDKGIATTLEKMKRGDVLWQSNQ